MAKCAICEKGVHYGNNVSHSHRRSNHVWKSNIKKFLARSMEFHRSYMYVLHV